jgi:hypothetical protein
MAPYCGLDLSSVARPPVRRCNERVQLSDLPCANSVPIHLESDMIELAARLTGFNLKGKSYVQKFPCPVSSVGIEPSEDRE